MTEEKEFEQDTTPCPAPDMTVTLPEIPPPPRVPIEFYEPLA
jgi:hypothetical protein